MDLEFEKPICQQKEQLPFKDIKESSQFGQLKLVVLLNLFNPDCQQHCITNSSSKEVSEIQLILIVKHQNRLGFHLSYGHFDYLFQSILFHPQKFPHCNFFLKVTFSSDPLFSSYFCQRATCKSMNLQEKLLQVVFCRLHPHCK